MMKPPRSALGSAALSGVQSAVGSMYNKPRTYNIGNAASATGQAALNGARPAALQRRLSRMNITQDDIDQQKKKRQNPDEDQIIRDMIARRKKGLTY